MDGPQREVEVIFASAASMSAALNEGRCVGGCAGCSTTSRANASEHDVRSQSSVRSMQGCAERPKSTSRIIYRAVTMAVTLVPHNSPGELTHRRDAMTDLDREIRSTAPKVQGHRSFQPYAGTSSTFHGSRSLPRRGLVMRLTATTIGAQRWCASGAQRGLHS